MLWKISKIKFQKSNFKNRINSPLSLNRPIYFIIIYYCLINHQYLTKMGLISPFQFQFHFHFQFEFNFFWHFLRSFLKICLHPSLRRRGKRVSSISPHNCILHPIFPSFQSTHTIQIKLCHMPHLSALCNTK